MNDNLYYNINLTLSHHCLFNFIIGSRGCGKTYGAKKLAINSFLSKGEQFIYVRRYKKEFKNNKSFFLPLANEFNEHTFNVKQNAYFIDDKIAGYAVNLSTAKIEKSTDYPLVTKIIFDEFIIDKGNYHYLPDEVVCFLELYETIARTRDVTVIFISNAVTFTNPYFLYFDLQYPYNKNIFKRGDILLELVDSEEFAIYKKQTRFGKIISDTPYGDYALNNAFLRDNTTFVDAHKSAHSHYFFSFLYNSELYGVWRDMTEGRLLVSQDIDESCKFVYTFKMEDHSPNTLLLKSWRSSLFLKIFIENYKLGNVYFESIKIKNIVQNVIKLTL